MKSDLIVSSSSDINQSEVNEALNLSKSSCPVVKNSCPFRDSKTVSDLKKTMSSVPPSYFSEVENAVLKSVNIAWKHMYNVSKNLSNSDEEETMQPFLKEMEQFPLLLRWLIILL